MQRLQNKNVKWINCNEEEEREVLTREQHNNLQLEAINERLYDRLKKSWDRFSVKEEELYELNKRE